MIAALLVLAVWAVLIAVCFSLCGAAARGDEMARHALEHRPRPRGWKGLP